jgi:hypothetical protein
LALPVYSVPLWLLPAGWPSGSTPQSPVVPAGFVWVVREVSAYYGGGSLGGGAPPASLLVTSEVVWTTPIRSAVAGQAYVSSDLRHVMNAADFMLFSTSSSSWALRVSGYQLTSS